MKKLMTFGASALALALLSTVQLEAQPEGRSASGLISNPAMTTPDVFAWNLFTEVVKPAPQGGMVFEGWAGDQLTFGTEAEPRWPTQRQGIQPREGRPTLLMAGGRGTTHGVGEAPTEPDTLHNLAQEEVRRNRPAFDYIVRNRLWRQSGLIAAFGRTIAFPTDSVEVKTNWLTVDQIRQYYPARVTGTDADIAKNFVVLKDKNGTSWAMVAMHVISKQVPNWTWATFEHNANPGRCDIIGCRDAFGAQRPFIPPVAKIEGDYGACAKTPALLDMMKGKKVAGQLGNYCLKGTQTDFTDATGLPVLLGNSVIEGGFVQSSSCMTCHGTAGWDRDGNSTQDTAPIGPISPAVFWNPQTSDRSFTAIATSADFVWSIPFCAYDDVGATKGPQKECMSPGR